MKAKKEIILIGGGGHCKSCIEVIESENEFEIAGIIDTANKVGQKVLGYEIIGSDDDLEKFREKYDYALITVGQIKSAALRIKLYTKAQELGFKFPFIKASTAYVSAHSEIHAGTIIMHGVIVNAGAKIGENNIINSKALVEHDTVIGHHNHISTNAILNGDVQIGTECFIGSNSTFVNGVSIGNNVFIGLNSVINKNLTEKGIYVGNPIRKIR